MQENQLKQKLTRFSDKNVDKFWLNWQTEKTEDTHFKNPK